MNEEYNLELYPEDFALVKEINESISSREKYQALKKAKEELLSLKNEQKKAVQETLDKALIFAKANNFECLSKNLKGHDWPISWQCHVGHKWKETLTSLGQHATCPACEKAKLKQRIAVDAN